MPCPQHTVPVPQCCGASHCHVAPAFGDVVGQVAVLAMQVDAGVDPLGVSQQYMPGSQGFDAVPPSPPAPAPGQNTPENPASVAVNGCNVGSLPHVPPESLASPPLVVSSLPVSATVESVVAESLVEESAVELSLVDESIVTPPVSVP